MTNHPQAFAIIFAILAQSALWNVTDRNQSALCVQLSFTGWQESHNRWNPSKTCATFSHNSKRAKNQFLFLFGKCFISHPPTSKEKKLKFTASRLIFFLSAKLLYVVPYAYAFTCYDLCTLLRISMNFPLPPLWHVLVMFRFLQHHLRHSFSLFFGFYSILFGASRLNNCSENLRVNVEYVNGSIMYRTKLHAIHVVKMLIVTNALALATWLKV